MSTADEGRELLAMILEDEATLIDLEEKEDGEIEAWLEELGYGWDEDTETWTPMHDSQE